MSLEIPKEILEPIKLSLGPLYEQKVKSLGGKILQYKGKGCDRCERTGFIGRTGVFEVLTMSEKIGLMTLEHKASSEIEKQAISDGMITLVQDGYLKVLEGITTIEEVLRVAED